MYNLQCLKELSRHGSIITNQIEISNVFNNYFATIADKAKENINLSHKNISYFLKNIHHNYFFLSPTNKLEIPSIIPWLDSNTSVGSNSISLKILKLLKNDISNWLGDIQVRIHLEIWSIFHFSRCSFSHLAWKSRYQNIIQKSKKSFFS